MVIDVCKKITNFFQTSEDLDPLKLKIGTRLLVQLNDIWFQCSFIGPSESKKYLVRLDDDPTSIIEVNKVYLLVN